MRHAFCLFMSLTDEPIPVLVRRIAIPASVGFFFNTMFNFLDTFCAGLISTDALAALSLSFPVFFILLSAGSGMSQGTTALMANALGRKEPDEARRIFGQSLLLASTAGVVLSIVGLFVAPWLFQLLGAEGDYLKTAMAFMSVTLYGGVFFILQMTLNAALSAHGDTTLYRNVLIGSFLANCVLNPVLMYGWTGLPPLGVAGIALATDLVQVGSCIVLWRGLKTRGFCQPMSADLFRPRWDLMRQIIGQAVPAGLNMMTVAVGIFVITWFVKHFGKEAVAAYGIATRVEQVLLLPTIGLNFAVLSLVGQNNGAGRMDRVGEAWRTCLRYGIGMMLVGGLLLFLVRGYAMALITKDPAVVAHGADYLSIASITLCAYPILFLTVFMLQGLKRPAYGLWLGLFRQIIGPWLVFNFLAFTLGWQIWGVWRGISIVTWSAALFTLWWGSRVLAEVQKKEE